MPSPGVEADAVRNQGREKENEEISAFDLHRRPGPRRGRRLGLRGLASDGFPEIRKILCNVEYFVGRVHLPLNGA